MRRLLILSLTRVPNPSMPGKMAWMRMPEQFEF